MDRPNETGADAPEVVAPKSERDHVEESMHFLMINVLVDSFETGGFTVRADHVGGLRPRPEAIGGFTPDIEARRGDDVRLVEVETQATLELPRTREQIAHLSGQVHARCYLAVPFDCIERARKLRECAEAKIGILPCYPFVRHIGIPK
jgi:hypothetical protein